jgi:hypothetical protein
MDEEQHRDTLEIIRIDDDCYVVPGNGQVPTTLVWQVGDIEMVVEAVGVN